jgi:hypothetical protein
MAQMLANGSVRGVALPSGANGQPATSRLSNPPYPISAATAAAMAIAQQQGPHPGSSMGSPSFAGVPARPDSANSMASPAQSASSLLASPQGRSNKRNLAGLNVQLPAPATFS